MRLSVHEASELNYKLDEYWSVSSRLFRISFLLLSDKILTYLSENYTVFPYMFFVLDYFRVDENVSEKTVPSKNVVNVKTVIRHTRVS